MFSTRHCASRLHPHSPLQPRRRLHPAPASATSAAAQQGALPPPPLLPPSAGSVPLHLVPFDANAGKVKVKLVFDISKTPVRHCEFRRRIETQPRASSSSSSPKHPVTSRPRNEPWKPPAPLPAPILFDGPAHPRHPPRHSRRFSHTSGPSARPSAMIAAAAAAAVAESHPSAVADHATHAHAPALSESQALRSKSATIGTGTAIQTFDGPAKITRYRHQPQTSGSSSSSSKNRSIPHPGLLVSGALVAIAGIAGAAKALGHGSITNKDTEFYPARVLVA